MHTIFAKAVAFKEAMSEGFHATQQRTVDKAKALAAALTRRGLRLVSGGTDNHLILIDLRPLNLTGKAAANLLDDRQRRIATASGVGDLCAAFPL